MNKSRIDAYIMAQEGLRDCSRETLEAFQLAQLNKALARMHAHGVGDVPAHLESLAALQTLPFTTAADLAAQPSRYLLLSQSEVARIITDQTSGTTAAAKRVFYTEADTAHTIDFFAAGIREMAVPGDSVLITMPFSGALGLGDLIKRAVEKIGARPLCAGWGKSYEELSDLIVREKPRCYIGFPVPLLSLARYMGEDFSIERALISGDSCPRGVLALLEAQMTLYPHYGSRELCMGGAITCQAFSGMHVRENHFIVEVVDENGQLLPDGEEGEMVITTIGMEAMPLVRYRTGDRTRIIPAPCPCGSVTKRIDAPFRLGRDAALLERLDSALFRVPAVVDTHVSQGEAGMYIRALVGEDCEAALLQAAGSIGKVAAVETRLCQGADTPLYSGKRVLKKREDAK